MMVGAYTNLQGALLNLMEALVAAYMGKVMMRIIAYVSVVLSNPNVSTVFTNDSSRENGLFCSIG